METSSSKSIKIAYLLWLLLGLFGAHRFYLKKKTSGVILLILTLIWGLSYGYSAEEPRGILSIIESLSPIQDSLTGLGKIGKWLSALLFLPMLLFPALWWVTDAFRIPRLFKLMKRE